LRDSGVREVAVVLGDLALERAVEYYEDGKWLVLIIIYVYRGYFYVFWLMLFAV